MSYLPNQGQKPDGSTQQIPLGGSKFSTTTPLGASASVSTGWMDTSGYGALLYVIRADQNSSTGGIVIEYSNNGSTAIMGGAAGTYTELNTLTQTALVPKARYTRITYTNGSVAQTSFYFEVKLSTTLIQPTENSVNKPTTPTNLAMVTKSIVELPDETGAFDTVQRTSGSMNVHVDNPGGTSVDTSTLAKDATLISGNQKTQITNFPATQPVSGTVAVSSIPEVEIKNDTGTAIPTTLAGSSSATVTTNTTLATVTTVLAANPNRKGAKFYSVTGTILIKYGTSASTTNFTERLVTNGTHELPGPEPYKGVVTAIGAGTLNVTEW